MKYEVDV